MAVDEKIKQYLSLTASDKSKTVGLMFGNNIVEPGKYVPRSGVYTTMEHLPIVSSPKIIMMYTTDQNSKYI